MFLAESSLSFFLFFFLSVLGIGVWHRIFVLETVLFDHPLEKHAPPELRRRAMHQRLPFPRGGCHIPLRLFSSLRSLHRRLLPPHAASGNGLDPRRNNPAFRRVGAVDAALPWKPDAPSATPSHGAFNRGAAAIRVRKCNGTSITGIILAKDTFFPTPQTPRFFSSLFFLNSVPRPARHRINPQHPRRDLSYARDR